MPGIPVLLFLVFLVLKLTEFIDWSWWWVTAPLWISALVFLFIGLPLFLFTANKIERQHDDFFRRF